MINDNDQEFESVRKVLKEIQQVKAPNYFEADLMRKINAGNFPEEASESWLSRILLPKRFIPSAALAVAAVLILFVFKPGSSEIENPFNTQPKIRKDLVNAQLSSQEQVDKALQEMVENKKDNDLPNANSGRYKTEKSKSNETASSSGSENFETVAAPGFSSFNEIDKRGLNFRQVNLTRSERMEINRLKENLMKFMDDNKSK